MLRNYVNYVDCFSSKYCNGFGVLGYWWYYGLFSGFCDWSIVEGLIYEWSF